MSKNKKREEKSLVRTNFGLPAFRQDFPFFSTTPFGTMRRFMDDMDRLLQDFNGGQGFDLTLPGFKEVKENAWWPKIEVVKQNGDMMVRAELPGMKREEINVEVSDGFLTLSGERKEEKEEKRKDFYRSEFSYGSFYRSIPIPEAVKPEDATAKFENGVLEVKVALPAVESNARKIEIQPADTDALKAATATT